jgi:hypothetical protein
MSSPSRQAPRRPSRRRRRLVLAAMVLASVLATIVPSAIAVGEHGLDTWLERIVAEPDG